MDSLIILGPGINLEDTDLSVLNKGKLKESSGEDFQRLLDDPLFQIDISTHPLNNVKSKGKVDLYLKLPKGTVNIDGWFIGRGVSSQNIFTNASSSKLLPPDPVAPTMKYTLDSVGWSRINLSFGDFSRGTFAHLDEFFFKDVRFKYSNLEGTVWGKKDLHHQNVSIKSNYVEDYSGRRSVIATSKLTDSGGGRDQKNFEGANFTGANLKDCRNLGQIDNIMVKDIDKLILPAIFKIYQKVSSYESKIKMKYPHYNKNENRDHYHIFKISNKYN